MPSIDERVVAMAFENAKFEAGVATTLRTLDKLNASLANVGKNNGLSEIEKSASKVTLDGPMSALDKLKSKLSFGSGGTFQKLEADADRVTLAGPIGAFDKLRSKLGGGLGEGTKSFAQLEAASDKVHLSGISGALDQITAKFSILDGAAAVALGGIATKAGLVIAELGQKLTGIKAIQDGFSDYELKIGATQTIMAGTGKDIDTVSEALKQLDQYADQTIYSLKDMTGNIGKFTNAGVPLQVAVDAMKGISNEAALSGANTEEAARSMYNLGQAIGSGTVRLADWRSVDLANMGTKEFKEQLIEAALAAGTLKKSSDGTIRSLKGNEVNFKTFNATLQDQWLTSEALTTTLSKYADKTTDLGKRAYAAATNVKTFSMMIETLAAAAGTGWTDTFEIIFGNLPQATKMWTDLTNAIGGIIGKSGEMRNKLLKDWADLGGRTELIEGVKAAFSALLSFIKPIREGFREIFPRQTGQNLLEMTKQFRSFFENLKLSAPTIDVLRRIFAGLFAVLHIGWTVIKETVKAIGDLLGIVGEGSGGILNFAGSIGDFLVSLDKAISQGGLLKGVFAGIVSGLGGIISLFKAVGVAIGSIFTGADKATGVTQAFADLTEGAGPLAAAAEFVADAWDRVRAIFAKLGNFLAPVIATVKAEASRLGEAIGEAFKTENFDKVMSVLQTGFLGGILLVLKRFRSSLNITLEGGLFEKVNNVLGALTGNLKAMQQNLQAKTLFAIAASLGVLVAGIYVLSTIDGKKLTTAMTAMAVGMGQLVGAIGLLGHLMQGPGKAGILMMPFIAVSLIGLAVAATILAAAVKIFSTMSWDELIKGLVGVGVALTSVGLATKLMGPGLLIQGPALIALAIGLNILAAAVKQFGELSWEELVKGLVGVAGGLVAMAAGLAFMGPSLIIVGPGLIAASIGLSLLAGAVGAFGSMSTEQLAKGILGIAGAIVALGLSISLIPPTVALQGAGLILLAAGLTGLSAAIAILGNMEVKTLVKGIIAMGGALVVLGLGLTAMSGTLIGSVALLAAAAAFAILGPAIAFMGNLKWSTILSGLAAMAATLGVLAIAGLVVVAPITALSFALGAFGIALALVTSPIYVLAKALELLGATGTKGVAVMVTALTAFVALLPKIIIDFLKGLVEIIAGIAELAPKVVSSIGIIIGQLLAVIVDAAPKVAVAVIAMVTSFVAVLNNSGPKLFDAGFRLVGSFLNALSANVGKFTAKAAEIISKFLDGLKGQSPKITTAGVGTLTAFLGGISAQFPKLVGTVVTMVTRFVGAVAANIPKIIGAATNLILKFIGGIVSMVPHVISAGVRIIGDFLTGIAQSVPKIVGKAAEVAAKFITGVSKGLVRIINIGADAVIDFLNGVANAIRTKGPELRAAGWNIADAILDGIVEGFKELGNKAVDAVKAIINALPKAAKKVLGIKSPSTVFAEIGKHTVMGLDQGLKGHEPMLAKTASGIGNGLIGAFKDVFQIRSPSRVLRDIGKNVVRGFADGLEGSKDDIRGAFQTLRDQVRDEMRTQRDAIKENQKEIRDLNRDHAKKLAEIRELKEHPKKNKDAIRDAIAEANEIERGINSASKSLYKHTNILDALQDANSELTAGLKSEKSTLIGYATELEDVTKKLDDANQALTDITNERKAFIEGIKAQFAKLPEFDKEAKDPVADYRKKLADQIEATKKFYETMKKLRAQGLDDVTFKKLLEGGLENASFAESLEGNTTAIKNINELDAELLDVTTKMGEDFGTSLYAVGIAAAEGLVKGLADRKGELETLMTDLAGTMVAAIKKALGIQSPSKVFAGVGVFAAEGLAQGFKDSTKLATDAATKLGTDTVAAIGDTLAHISEAVAVNVEMDPTITPVLDLTQVQKDAQKLSDLTNITPITAAASYGQASAISAEQAAALAEAATTAQAAPTLNFEQNNYSPEALSDIEIYRQTKNQLGQVKSALGLAT